MFVHNVRFVGANSALFGLFPAPYSFPFVIAIFLQDIQGYSVTEAALRLLPWPIAFIITSRFVPRVIRAHGNAGPLVFGTLGLALAVLLISFAAVESATSFVATLVPTFSSETSAATSASAARAATATAASRSEGPEAAEPQAGAIFPDGRRLSENGDASRDCDPPSRIISLTTRPVAGESRIPQEACAVAR
jgi:hypothetical protein